MGLYEVMKAAASKERDASVPCDVMFGTVTKAAPLEILVDNRFQISGDMIIVPRELRAGEAPAHTHTIAPHQHSVSAMETTLDGYSGTEKHRHGVPAHSTSDAELQTVADGGANNGLSAGENVILIRCAGGQRFLVVGRL